MHNETLAVTGGRKRGRPAGSDSEQTRRTILAAARDTIAERGYRAATFQLIAQRAGVSRPTLHYYFDTREELYDTLLADVCARVRQCAEVAAGEGSLRRQLAAFTSELGRLGAAEPAMMKLVVTARIDHHRAQYRHDAAAEIVATVHGFYDAAVADAARRGELPAGTDPRAVSDMLSALFWGLGFHAGFLTPGTPVHNAPEVARQLLALLDGGLLNGSLGAPSAT
ncbi:TetR/AcrR family transcriptional regulator [Mycolicibacterium parafortuitum]|uniref:TetR family transcriptional regulator [Frankia symbiont of Datisca glomerata] n=1 Tax=Mycolicibacterium parafortuitum TaxID=39692 RepID=A0A375YLI1_MYCPF|nr:TetR/AcrR family transcriptional regulator [Mycolicibacterium parafortuitum]ORB30417.1 TetR family transcriptional regulator [Mycolicibacterium parafortuitum]SRX81899.1 TetR family transcriptional regulator [Frankia symbiont of Datisca glomerata] [Mycolicibacterium parafortuitum]